MKRWEDRKKARKERWEAGGNLFGMAAGSEALKNSKAGKFLSETAKPIESGSKSDANSGQSGKPTALGMQTVHPQISKHARRLYIGQVPRNLNSNELSAIITNIIRTHLHPRDYLDRVRCSQPVTSCYINPDREKAYGFLELGDVGLTLAFSTIDNVQIPSIGGFPAGSIRIRRPNDYDMHRAKRDGLFIDAVAWTHPENGDGCRFDLSPESGLPASANQEVISQANDAQLYSGHGPTSGSGMILGKVEDGPNKIFIGGLPYNLTRENIMELLSAFGPLKAFHLVNSPDAPPGQHSKGYAFCEYADPENTALACKGLNGMMLGEKPLTCRVANPRNESQATRMGNDAGAAAMLPAAGTTSVNVDDLLSNAFNASAPAPSIVGGAVGVGTSVDDLLATAMGGAQPQPTQQQFQGRILKLMNMVTQEDLDEDDEEYNDLLEDIRGECKKFGNLIKVKIPRKGPHALCVYLEYGDNGSAGNAARDLDGREFGDSTVRCDECTEEVYATVPDA